MLRYCFFTFTLAFSFAGSAQQNNASQWGNLKPGPYAIGYKTIRLIDPTRNYFDVGRPLQIYVWYPSTLKAGEKQMQYADYFNDIVYDWGNDPNKVARLKSMLIKDFRISSLGPSYPAGLHDTIFERILSTPIPVYRNAVPASERFPVLLHAHAHGLLSQSIMAEYMASHGYVFMSISSYGSSPAFYGRGEDGNNALLNLTLDMALVMAEARKLEYADINHVGMIGMMAQGGLSLQFKEMPLDGIACLDCTFNPEAMKKLPYYDPKKIRIPIMELINTDVPQQTSFLDSLPYAERLIGRFHVFPHADFYPFPKIARPAESKGFTNYEYLLAYTLRFFEGIFRNDESAQKFATNPGHEEGWPAGYLFVRRKAAAPIMPTENEVLTWLRYGETTRVNEAWENFGKKLFETPNNLFFITLFLVRDNEPQAFDAVKIYAGAFPDDNRIPALLNNVGYGLINAKKLDQAREVFEFFSKQYPLSPYAWNGLSDVAIARGDKTTAKTHAKKVMEILEKAIMSPQEKQALKDNAQLILDLR